MSSDEEFQKTRCQRTAQKSAGVVNDEQDVVKKVKEETITKTVKSPQFDTKDGDVNVQEESEKYCPYCQVPFACLSTVDSVAWHVSLCSIPSKSKVQCKDGCHCSSTIPSHYKKFLHSELASSRDSGSSNAYSIIDQQITSPDKDFASHQTDHSFNSVIVPVKKNTSSENEVINTNCTIDKTMTLDSVEVIDLELIDTTSVSKPVSATCKNPVAQGKRQSLLSSYFKTPQKSNTTKKSEECIIPVEQNQLETNSWQQNSSKCVDSVHQFPVINLAQGSLPPYQSGSSAAAPKTRKRKNTPRPCPFYKWIPDTSFTVDAFSFGVLENCSVYFLSHFHSDHYKGLTSKFTGKIVCSKVTANLITQKLKVDPALIKSCEVDESINVEGVRVTLIEANHCPGAVLFLFENDEKISLHTGDFRADLAMLEHPALKELCQRDGKKGLQLSNLFLDTTYCKPEYTFPPQHNVIDLAVNLCIDFVKQHPRALLVSGTYTIGKEKLFLAIAKALHCSICVKKEKMEILKCLEDEMIDKLMTLDPVKAKLHVLPMNLVNKKSLLQYLGKLKHHYDCILAFKPTGWTFNQRSNPTIGCNDEDTLKNIKPMCNSNGITIYGVPYSEHSSFSELKMFVQAFQPTKIIPTVNVEKPAIRNVMEETFKQWLA